ncbi:MAG: hypothetical protein C0404_07380, partial [Verrucomicrobia bacterium]|nr:hypothetical protein [Verrucomicrobiota bacterium]
ADDGGTVNFTGGGSGLLKHINTNGVAYIVNCAGATNGLVTCVSGRSFAVADAGLPVRHVVAECYNDWPTGLVDNVSIAGWKTSISHMIKIRAAQGHRHNGTLSLTQATGFTLRNSGNTAVVMISPDYVVCHVQLEGLCLYSSSSASPVVTTSQHSSMRECVVRGGSAGLETNVRVESDVVNCVFYDQAQRGIGIDIDAGKNLNVFNSTFCGSPYGIYRMRSDMSSVLNVANCLMKCSTAGIVSIGAVSVNYTATSDATADDFGGAGNRINQTFKFMNEAADDFHLAADDMGAKDRGSSAVMVLADVDGDNRMDGLPDIGADESPGSVQPGVDAYGIPDAWKIQYFGSASATNAGALIDADGDGMCNLSEFIAGTCPTNATSRFQVLALRSEGGGGEAGFSVTFQTVTGRLYTARYCDNLLAGSWGVLAPSNAAGTGGQMTITDTNKPAIRFYRLGVKMQ